MSVPKETPEYMAAISKAWHAAQVVKAIYKTVPSGNDARIQAWTEAALEAENDYREAEAVASKAAHRQAVAAYKAAYADYAKGRDRRNPLIPF